MKRGRAFENLTPLCQLITYILLVLSVLFLVYTGIYLFQRITEVRQDEEHLRSTLSYVQNQLYMCEDPGAVAVKQGPEGDMICLPLAEGRFEIKIYLYDGYLREELSLQDAEADPAESEKIAQASVFTAELSDASLLKVSIDGRAAYAALREAAHE